MMAMFGHFMNMLFADMIFGMRLLFASTCHILHLFIRGVHMTVDSEKKKICQEYIWTEGGMCVCS